MSKSTTDTDNFDPYEYYLADLLKEIDDAGCCNKPTVRRRLTWVADDGVNAGAAERQVCGEIVSGHRKLTREENKAVHALLPKPQEIKSIPLQGAINSATPEPIAPYPPIFNTLPSDILPNIERAVKIYCRYIRALNAQDISERANALHIMAEEIAKRRAYTGYEYTILSLDAEDELDEKIGRKEITQEDSEKYLNAHVLVALGKEQEEDHHLDFFILSLMQLGCYANALKAACNKAKKAWLDEIAITIEQGYRQLDIQYAYERRKKEENKVRSKQAVKATKTRHAGNSKNARVFCEKLYIQKRNESQKNNLKISKRSIAFDIHRELSRKHIGENYDSGKESGHRNKEDDARLKKAGWFFPQDQEYFYRNWVLPFCDDWG